MGYVKIKYLQRERNSLYKLEERFGSKTFVYQKPGFEDFEQEEDIEANLADKRIKELSSFTNRNYHSFVIIKN